MKNNSFLILIQVVTVFILSFFCYQNFSFSLNTFLLFLYLLTTSFLNYKSVDKNNIIHISWMSVSVGMAIWLDNYYLQVVTVALTPLTLVLHFALNKRQKIFTWLQFLNILTFFLSIWLMVIGEKMYGLTFAISALLIRQSQFPFYIWFRELKNDPESFPSFLYFVLVQTGFIIYAESILHIYHPNSMHLFVTSITLFSGLMLAFYALRETHSMTKHLLVIMSQSCLPLAAYESFSTTSATGGLLFSLTIALGGSIYGLFAFHFYKQKQIINLDQYYSLYRSNKNLAAVYFVCGFSLVGLPFTIGYFAEDVLFHGLIETATYLAPLYIIMTAINGYTVYYTFNRIFFGHTQKRWSNLYFYRHSKILIAVSAIVLSFGVIVLGNISTKIEAKIEGSHKELLKTYRTSEITTIDFNDEVTNVD